MSQTKPMPIDQLVRLPWSFEGPVADPDGGFVIRIAELPGLVVAAETRDQVLVDLRLALRAFLESYTEFGETPPLPADLDGWQMELSHAAASSGGGVRKPKTKTSLQSPWESTGRPSGLSLQTA